MLAGTEIELYDEGRGLRDYTYVDDVVDAFMRMIDWIDGDLTVNVGSHAPVTTAGMVDALERGLGVDARRILVPAQVGDVPATYADISRAQRLLGWIPNWKFDDGIAAFCAWLRAELRPAEVDA
jgi:UDP-glucuronate 4-epimerase